MSTEAGKLYERANALLEGKVDHDPAEVFALLYTAAEQGHAEAQIKVGRYYNFGEITSENLPKAAHYYSLAAKQGNAEGLVRLAKCYLHDPARYQLEEETSEAQTDDYYYEKKAFNLLKRAAKQNHAGAIYEMADFIEQGRGGLSERQAGRAGDGFDEERKEGYLKFDDQRRAKSKKMYIDAAELGSLQSQQKVFWYYLTVQIGNFYDTEKITYWITRLLENKGHNSETLGDLGRRLQSEVKRITTIDYEKEEFINLNAHPHPNRSQSWIKSLYKFALEAYRKAFELGCKKSAKNAGEIYLFGPDSIRDEFMAYDLFKKSGSDDYAAYCHTHGLGCTLNFREAIRLLEKACDEMVQSKSWSTSRVAFDLGQLYEVYGGEDCLTKAYEAYCKGDSSQCIYQIGMCHLLAKGVEKNEARAFECFMTASSKIPHTPIDSEIQCFSSGDRSAHGDYGLALCFHKGSGIKQSHGNAFHCLSKAVARGKMHSKYICPSEREVYRDSLFLLGLFWHDGFGVTKNHENSSYFYSLAARLGHKDAMLSLAKMLEQRAANEISFELFHQEYVDDFESDVLCAEHMRSLALGLGRGNLVDEDMPFAYYQEKQQRPDADELDGLIVDPSSFDWEYNPE